MNIDISKLDEAELVELNRRIVARLKYLQEARTHHQMLSFNVGDRVRFHPPGHDPKTGVIVKYNRKTVTVVTDDRHQWNVAPVFLSRVVDADAAGSGNPGQGHTAADQAVARRVVEPPLNGNRSFMPQLLTDAELEELRDKFKDIVNYEGDDPCKPVDPLTYVAPDGDTCLHIAAHRGDLRAIELLVKAGANLDQQGDMGYTALHYAATPEVVDFLIKSGASTTILNEFGKAPIGWNDRR